MKYVVILLLFWAVLELRAKWQEFCDWLESEAESLHRDRIRKSIHGVFHLVGPQSAAISG